MKIRTSPSPWRSRATHAPGLVSRASCGVDVHGNVAGFLVPPQSRRGSSDVLSGVFIVASRPGMSTQDGFVVSSPGSSGAAPWFYVFCEPYVYYKNRCNHRDGTRLCGPCSDACVLGRLGGKAGCQSFLAVSCAFWWFVVVVNAPLVPPEHTSVARGRR